MQINLIAFRQFLFAALAVAVLAATPAGVRAIEPVDPDLIPEAREVLDFLASIYGKRTLIGQDKFWEAQRFHEATGKYPAIISSDLSGWSKTRWDNQYKQTLQRAVDQSKDWWHKQGGIVSFAWHWANPMSPAGTFEATRPGFAKIDVGQVLTPGTKEHEAAMEDLRRHADYLEQFAKARVPVLWRPLHEIEGGWFWWSDTKTPENTAKLWRMMFNYFVHQRKLHNVIWIYSAALKAGDHGKDVETIDYRKRFYPGDKYVDISGIDIYTNSWFGWADFREDSFPKAFQIMGQVTPGKMLALCECQGLPNPDIIVKQGPHWLYCLPWYVGKDPKWNPPDWVKKVHDHEVFVTLDRLPKWKALRSSQAEYRRFAVTRKGDVLVARFVDQKISDEDARIGEELLRIANDEPQKKILLDLGGVDDLGDAVLGRLIRMEKRVREQKKEMNLCNVHGAVREVFTITKLDKLFRIERDEAAGLKAFGQE